MSRRRLQGGLLILRLNWPFYVISAAALLAWPAAAFMRIISGGIASGAWLLWGIVLWWTAASLAASYWVYDRSRLCTWRWVTDVLPATPQRWINIHAGLDQSTPSLKGIFPNTHGTMIDIFDEFRMTEPAIRRARRHHDRTALPAAHSDLPIQEGRVNAVFLLFAAHELRTRASRDALFREISRVLAPGGRLIVAEHQRDPLNVAAFGPGAWHFLPRSEWLSVFREGGYRIDAEITITPLVHVWSMTKSDDFALPGAPSASRGSTNGSTASAPPSMPVKRH